MATVQTPQVKSWYPTVASDAGNMFVVRGKQSGTLVIAQNDIFEMVKVPQGAIIEEVIADMPACGAGVTMDIGITGVEENKFASAVDVSAAGIFRLSEQAGRGYEMLSDDTIDIKLEGANPTDDLTFSLSVYYRMA